MADDFAEELNNSVTTIDKKMAAILDNITEFEHSCRQDPSEITNEQWLDIQTSFEMMTRNIRVFVEIEINFRWAVDALKTEEEVPGTTRVSEGNFMDAGEVVKQLYHEVYAKYFATHALYQTFAKDHKLPQLELINECAV